MKSLLSSASWFAFATLALGACSDSTSATDLHPDGPPRVLQVLMKEVYQPTPGRYDIRLDSVFAFGSHPLADPSLVHPVTSAALDGSALRIVMSELLIGNNLEEIQCRGTVDSDAFDRVPLGATPDDIAKCCEPTDILPQSCKGSLAVCVGPDPTHPVGVQDLNEDGAADDTRFIQGAVGIKCGTINVPIDLDASYWNPSGDQQMPARGGFDELGPAIVLHPMGPLPSNLDCSLTFDPAVVDKQNNGVCIPPDPAAVAVDGDVNGLCKPGDLSAFHFHTDALRGADPFSDGSGVGRQRTLDVVISFNAPVDMTSLAGVTITENGAAFNGYTATLAMGKTLFLHPTAATGFAATSTYVITLPITVKDTWGQPLPAPLMFPFTTGAL
jgi:hypothetical protein